MYIYIYVCVTYVCVCAIISMIISINIWYTCFLMSMVSALLLVRQETSGVFGNEATNQGIKLRKESSGGPLPGLVLSIEVELICKTFRRKYFEPKLFERVCGLHGQLTCNKWFFNITEMPWFFIVLGVLGSMPVVSTKQARACSVFGPPTRNSVWVRTKDKSTPTEHLPNDF